MEPTLALLPALSLAAWVVLTFARARFWLGDQRLDDFSDAPGRWPAVVAVIPARDEADVVEESLGSLLEQDYPGSLRILLVDDESADETGALAERVAEGHPRGERLSVERVAARPDGWVGKMWALHSGLEAAQRDGPQPEYWLLTDADVRHSRGNLRRLVAKAEAEHRDLVSLMVHLDAERGWERLLIPAFVYFFQKLYPFRLVNNPRSRIAAAAGGCVLVRRTALVRAGGIEPLRGEIIDDCALGRAIKRSGGSIWLGLTRSECSIRSYGGLRGVWKMVARSAFTQLGHSWWLLAGTVVGLVLLYLVPPVIVLTTSLHRDPVALSLALAAWLVMAATFVPMLTLYGRAPWWGLALPVAGALYIGMTLDSARRHRRSQGALWKGRHGAGSDAASRLGAPTR
jgi:hopene-associated glycosyltransferase HpnB